MSLGHGASIIRNGLVLLLDAANKKSYPGSGTSWIDLSGNALNGTLTNGPTYDTTNNGSLVFDGTNDYVAFANSASVQFLGTSPYTLQAWINLSTIPGFNTYQGIINRENSDIGSRDGYNLWINQTANGSVHYASERYCGGSGASASYIIANSTVAGAWTYVAVAYSGYALTLFYNGAVVNNNISSAVLANSISNNTKTIEIASRNGAYINAKIPHVAIYNRALTNTEIQQNFNAHRGRYGV